MCCLVVPLVPEHEVHGVAGQHHEGQVDVAPHLEHVHVVVQGVAVSLLALRLEAEVGQAVHRLNTHGHTYRASNECPQEGSQSWRRPLFGPSPG